MKFEKFKNNISDYTKEFVRDDSGMELLQFAIVVVISCGLIGAVKAIQSAVDGKLRDSAEVVENGFDTNIN